MRALVLIGAGLVAAGLAWPSGMLVVSDASGAARWRVPVAEGTQVVLHYTNSVYLAPTWERFTVRGGRLHLKEVSSTREAVLEYNRLAPPYRRDGSTVTARISGVVLEVLSLRVGERGHPVLQVGQTEVPLYRAGTGTGLRVTIRREARLQRWLIGQAP